MHPSTVMSRRALLAHAGALAAVLAACGSDDKDAAPSTVAPTNAPTTVTPTTAAPTTTAAPAFPRTIDHELGSTIIDAKPTRVLATSDFADLDTLLALGVQPVAYGFTNSWDTGRSPWQEAAGVAELEQFVMDGELSVETVIAHSPDLVVGMPWPLDQIYDTVSDVAPTVVLSWTQPWRDALRIVGAAVGRDAEAEVLIGDVEAALADAREQLAPYADLTFMVGSNYADVLYVQGEESSVTALLREVGLTVAGAGGDDPVMAALSLEQVDVLADADVVLSLATDVDATATLESSALWKNLPAVQAGRYTAIPNVESRCIADGFGALSYSWLLPRLISIVTEAAEGRGTPLG